MAGTPLAVTLVYKLTLAKLFFDQALPSAGLSGTVVVAQALAEQDLASIGGFRWCGGHTTSFFIAYATALAAAITILFFLGHANFVLVSLSVLFIFLSVALVVGIQAFSGRDVLGGRPHWLFRYRVIQNAAGVMKDADLQLVHNVRLQLIASCFQLVTFLLDAANT